MTYHFCRPIFTAVLTALFVLWLSPSSAGSAALQIPAIDLAKTLDDSELTGFMQSISGPPALQPLKDALESTDWNPPGHAALNAPRKHSTIWLKATLHNSRDEILTRWLVLEPWRLNRVDAFLLNPQTGQTLQHEATGLTVPLQARAVSNGKTIVPVHLYPGETQDLLLKIYSDSLPFISVKNWEPNTYSQRIHDKRMFQVALLAGILMLLVVLALQFNAGLFIAGLWLLFAFICETEKDGLLSNYLLTSLEAYSMTIRATACVLAVQLFLATSIFLLGLNRSRGWRLFVILTFTLSVTTPALTFMVDGATVRNIGVFVVLFYMLSWLFILASALRTRCADHTIVLILLSIHWGYLFLQLLGYVFNFYYTSAFDSARIYIEILIALGLILIYARQHKQKLIRAEEALKLQETESRKQLEKRVKDRTEELNSALETARKASVAKVNFLGQITHDLRSPLTAILGYAQLQAADVVSAKKANQIIQDNALYMKDLVTGLVDYARDFSNYDLKKRDVYLIAFIDNLVNQAHLLAGKQNNRFQLKIESELPTVIRFSGTQVQRILINLLDNAAKYTRYGQISLIVATGNTQDGSPALIFRISDTGIGIPAEQVEKIYSPYYQGSEHNPGAGLGLSISLELAERLGGTLELSSELGEGTVATCIIPYAAGDEQIVTPALPAMQEFLPVFNAQGLSAWIVEDSQQILELLDSELTEMGFETTLFASAEAFMSFVGEKQGAQHSQQPAIIMTDYQLPGASGLEVLKTSQAQWPSVPVILLSGTQNSNPQAFESDRLRFNAYLSKPVGLLELRLTLAELCKLTSSE